MSPIILRPTAAELEVADRHLPEMMRYVETLLDQIGPEVIAANASLVYLAVMTAFRNRNLLQIAWAPRLSIEVASQDYEIVLYTDSEMVVSEELQFSPKSSLSKGVSPYTPSSLNRNGNTLGELLASLEFRSYEAHISPKGLVVENEQTVNNAVGEDSWGIPKSFRLRHLDEKALNLSVAVNWGYWRLGAAYQRFSDENADLMGADNHPRALQQALLSRLCSEAHYGNLVEDRKAVAGLKKRLQRGRKFHILASIFGTSILNAVPEISVTRLDKVGITALTRLSSGSVEGAKVKVILEKMLQVSEVSDV